MGGGGGCGRVGQGGGFGRLILNNVCVVVKWRTAEVENYVPFGKLASLKIVCS